MRLLSRFLPTTPLDMASPVHWRAKQDFERAVKSADGPAQRFALCRLRKAARDFERAKHSTGDEQWNS